MRLVGVVSHSDILDGLCGSPKRHPPSIKSLFTIAGRQRAKYGQTTMRDKKGSVFCIFAWGETVSEGVGVGCTDPDGTLCDVR